MLISNWFTCQTLRALAMHGESSYKNNYCAKRSLRSDWQFGGLQIMSFFFSFFRKVITFCEEDMRVGTGPERLGGLTHDFEADPKVTPLQID